MNIICCSFPPAYETVGCYKDTANRTISSLEGQDPILDGPFTERENAISKCASAAIKAGFIIFAIQDGGQCFSSATAPQTFDKYGESNDCQSDGEGGRMANHVYYIKGTIEKLRKKYRSGEEHYHIWPI